MSTLFSAKLTVVMQVLSLTRGQLAAELGVDKSIVGRWVTGRVTPSSHNLTRLTDLVAGRIGEFRLIDWERDLAGLEGLLGAPVASLSSARASRLPPNSPCR